MATSRLSSLRSRPVRCPGARPPASSVSMSRRCAGACRGRVGQTAPRWGVSIKACEAPGRGVADEFLLQHRSPARRGDGVVIADERVLFPRLLRWHGGGLQRGRAPGRAVLASPG
jgi:hypothetical protein